MYNSPVEDDADGRSPERCGAPTDNTSEAGERTGKFDAETDGEVTGGKEDGGGSTADCQKRYKRQEIKREETEGNTEEDAASVSTEGTSE